MALPYKIPSLQTGMAGAPQTPQKAIQPMAAPTQPTQPGLMDWNKLASQKYTSEVAGTPQGFNNQGFLNSYQNLAKTIGYQGNPVSQGQYTTTGYGEGGETQQTQSGYVADPAFLKALEGYKFSAADTGDGRANIGVYNPDGTSAGSYLHGDKNSSFDKFADKAVPIGLAALAGATFSGMIPGAEIGAASAPQGSLLGMDAAAYEAGLPGLAEGGVAAGEAGVGGLAGMPGFNPAPLPGAEGFSFANVGADAAGGALGNAEAAALAESGNALGGGLGAGISPGFEPLAAIGGEATAFGGLPALGELAAGAGAAGAGTAFGNFALPGAGASGGLAEALAGIKSGVTGAAGSIGSFIKENPKLAALGASGLAQLAGGSPSLPAAPGAGGGGGSSALATALEGQIGSMGAPDYSGVFGLKNTAGDLNTLNQEAIDAAYSQQTRMLDPQFQREKQAMEARLAEQGFVPGTPGYERAMSIFGEERTKAYGSARDSSILQGYQIGQGDARNKLSDAELNNSASRESLAQILAKRNQPFNELASVKANQQIDYNNSLDRYNAQVASSNSKNQALSQLAMALGMYLG